MTFNTSPVQIVTMVCLALFSLAVHAAPFGLPNPARTPGAVDARVTQNNIHQTICMRGYTRTVRPPESYTERLKRQQMRAYAYADQHIWHYEEDHLVPLEVGGAPRNPRNLWPEPRYGHWGARQKDRLENKLHREVCRGQISLHEAQRIFEMNWIRGDKKYVRP